MPPLPIATALIVLGSLVCLANGWTAIQRRRAGRLRSTVPLLGAVLLGAGLFFVPVARPFCWLALVLDYGTVELLLALPKVFGEFWSTSRCNLVAEYCGQAGGKTVCLRLFRRAIFTLRLRVQRPPGECGLVDAGTIGTWQRDGARLTLRAEGGEASFAVLGTAPAEFLRPTVGFPAWSNSPDRSLDGMELFPPNQRPNQRTN
jgi:hypothetical protein